MQQPADVGLKIHLLGRFEVWRVGVLLSERVLPPGKLQSLLKILLTQRGQVFTQDQLLEALFSDLDPEKATQNLHARLSEVRRVLEPELKEGRKSQFILSVGAHGYCFNKDAPCWIDTEEFQKQLELAQAAERTARWPEALRHYQEAIRLYQGDFLSEDLYEEWTMAAREKWREAYLAALGELANCHAHLGQYGRAIEQCQRLIELAPSRESPYRQRMLYQYLAGDRSAAVQAYQACLLALQQHLSVEPSAQTQQLHQRILQDQVPKEDYPPLKKPEVLKLFKGVSLFSELSEEECIELWNHCEFHEYAQGDYIIQEGDLDSTKLYLIVEGQVEIRRGDRPIAKRGIGCTIGEMALLTGNPRSADVVALKRVWCLVLTQQDLLGLVQTHPATGLKMMADLAHRLRSASETLSQHLPKEELKDL